MLTERVVALPYGSGEESDDRARVRRTRTRARVVDTDSNHKARVWAQLHRLKIAAVGAPARRRARTPGLEIQFARAASLLRRR